MNNSPKNQKIIKKENLFVIEAPRKCAKGISNPKDSNNIENEKSLLTERINDDKQCKNKIIETFQIDTEMSFEDKLIDQLNNIEHDDELEQFLPQELTADDKIKKIDSLLSKKSKGSIKISKCLKRRL